MQAILKRLKALCERLFWVTALCLAFALTIYTAILANHSRRFWSHISGVRNARPVPVTETEVLDGSLYISSPAPSSLRRLEPAYVLLVIVSPQCEPCEQALRQWLSVAPQLFAEHKIALWLVTSEKLPDADPLLQKLGGVPGTRILQVGNVGAYIRRTGIAMVPMALLVGRDRTLLATVSGIPSAPTAGKVLRIITTPRPTKDTALFVERNASVWPLVRP